MVSPEPESRTDDATEASTELGRRVAEVRAQAADASARGRPPRRPHVGPHWTTLTVLGIAFVAAGAGLYEWTGRAWIAILGSVIGVPVAVLVCAALFAGVMHWRRMAATTPGDDGEHPS